MDTSSALNTCKYINITLCMPWIWAPSWFVCILGCKSNEISLAQTTHHTSCIQKGLHAWKWLDIMTSKPDSVSTLGYNWTDHTGRPHEPQVHWDATGTTLADASTHWCPSGDPVETHCNTTGRPLEDYWKHTGNTMATNNSFSNGIPVFTGV